MAASSTSSHTPASQPASPHEGVGMGVGGKMTFEGKMPSCGWCAISPSCAPSPRAFNDETVCLEVAPWQVSVRAVSASSRRCSLDRASVGAPGRPAGQPRRTHATHQRLQGDKIGQNQRRRPAAPVHRRTPRTWIRSSISLVRATFAATSDAGVGRVKPCSPRPCGASANMEPRQEAKSS
jgi:hypothetical protein